MRAASGAAWAITKIGANSHSEGSCNPISTPSATPHRIEAVSPMTSGWSVIRKALNRVPSAMIARRPPSVSRKVGKAGLSGIRPAYSQSARAAAKDTRRSTSGWIRRSRQRWAGALPSAGRAGASSEICKGEHSACARFRNEGSPGRMLHAPARGRVRTRLAAQGLACPLQRREVPEILDLQLGGRTLQLAGLGVELEISLRDLGAAAGRRIDAFLGRQRVEFGDALQYLLRLVGHQLALDPLLLDDRRIGRHFLPEPQEFGD